jgi:hypothetical protein
MATFKHNSWGRTRQPKNIAGRASDGTPYEVDVVAVATLDSVHAGYATESQRYLHCMLIDKNASTSLTVTLYGYSHAFGKWGPLNTLGVETGVDGTPLTITVADSGTAEGSQTAANREMVTWEIAGVDRVAFVGTTADVRCYAACSTF